jgi:hypothetical protein
MTLQEFTSRALEIFPGANIGGVTRDRHDPGARLDLGLIQTSDNKPITFDQLVRLASFSESRGIEIKASADPEPGQEGATILRIRVTL